MDLSQLYNDLDHIMMHCYDSATLQISNSVKLPSTCILHLSYAQAVFWQAEKYL